MTTLLRTTIFSLGAIAAVSFLPAQASATDSLKLLAQVAHLQAQSAGEDLETVADDKTPVPPKSPPKPQGGGRPQ